MIRSGLAARPNPFGEIATVLAVGVGLASLFSASRALVDLVSILECSGAMGGTRIPA